MTMYDYVWLCMTMHDYAWLCKTNYDYAKLWMILYFYIITSKIVSESTLYKTMCQQCQNPHSTRLGVQSSAVWKLNFVIELENGDEWWGITRYPLLMAIQDDKVKLTSLGMYEARAKDFCAEDPTWNSSFVWGHFYTMLECMLKLSSYT